MLKWPIENRHKHLNVNIFHMFTIVSIMIIVVRYWAIIWHRGVLGLVSHVNREDPGGSIPLLDSSLFFGGGLFSTFLVFSFLYISYYNDMFFKKIHYILYVDTSLNRVTVIIVDFLNCPYSDHCIIANNLCILVSGAFVNDNP